MPNQSIIGQSGSLLGEIALATFSNQFLPFGFKTHVLSSNTIRVAFEVPVDDSALNPNSYSITFVSGVPQIFVPSVVAVKFFDTDMTSVEVIFSASLTLSAVYSLQVNDVFSLDGRVSSISTYNFLATVPAPPRAVAAFMSSTSCIDVVFDKLVRDTSAIYATAQIVPIDANGTALPLSNLVPVVSVPDVPETNLRFLIQPGMVAGNKFLIQYQQAVDSSYNAGDGEIFLDVRLSSPPPWSYLDLSTSDVIAAYVDRVVPDEYRVYVNVFFSCPMLATDIIDTSKWTVTKEGVHLSGASLPVVAPDPFDDASLIAVCSDLKNKFNAHLIIPNVHLSDADAFPRAAVVIGLLNNLLDKFNSHAVTVPSHTVSDRDNAVNLKPAFTIQQAVELSTALKTGFNTHLSASFGLTPYHFIDDIENAVVSPDPIDSNDIQAASLIADELRTRLLMHELGQWHSYVDTLNAPSFPYSRPECVFPSITIVSEAVSFLNELQAKYASHLIVRDPHLYSDDVNTIVVQTIIDPVLALPIASVMKQQFNGHILADFVVDVDSVSSFADPDSSSPVNDGFTYFARMKLKGSASIPKYTVTASLRDLNFQNIPFLFVTESFGLIDTLSVIPRKNSLIIRMPVGLNIPMAEDVSIVKSDGIPVKITGLSIDSSMQAVQNLITDLMNVFRVHLSENGLTYVTINGVPVYTVHQLNDTMNNFDDSNIPKMSEESIITAVNFLKNVFNRHVLNTDDPYHIFQVTDDSVSTPDATDFESSVALAVEISSAIDSHRKNLSSHFSVGPELQFSKIFDTLIINYDGLLNGSDYTLTANLKIVPNDPYASSAPFPFRITEQFSGISDPPYVASASPKPVAGRGLPQDKFVKDELEIFFSKTMREEFVTPTQIVVTGPVGLSVGNSYWEGSRLLRVQVNGMQDFSSYGLDVNLLTDSFGNLIQSY